MIYIYILIISTCFMGVLNILKLSKLPILLLDYGINQIRFYFYF